MAERRPYLLRLDPALLDALQRWAADELRSLNAQIEFLLRDALHGAGRLPRASSRTSAQARRPSKQPPRE